MDELDEKLKSIHDNDFSCIGHSEGQLCCLEHDEVVELIKQAFIDAGWHRG